MTNSTEKQRKAKVLDELTALSEQLGGYSLDKKKLNKDKKDD